MARLPSPAADRRARALGSAAQRARLGRVALAARPRQQEPAYAALVISVHARAHPYWQPRGPVMPRERQCVARHPPARAVERALGIVFDGFTAKPGIWLGESGILVVSVSTLLATPFLLGRWSARRSPGAAPYAEIDSSLDRSLRLAEQANGGQKRQRVVAVDSVREKAHGTPVWRAPDSHVRWNAGMRVSGCHASRHGDRFFMSLLSSPSSPRRRISS